MTTGSEAGSLVSVIDGIDVNPRVALLYRFRFLTFTLNRFTLNRFTVRLTVTGFLGFELVEFGPWRNRLALGSLAITSLGARASWRRKPRPARARSDASRFFQAGIAPAAAPSFTILVKVFNRAHVFVDFVPQIGTDQPASQRSMARGAIGLENALPHAQPGRVVHVLDQCRWRPLSSPISANCSRALAADAAA
jgi:hypothetical protein